MTGATDERLHRVIAVTNGKGGVGKCLTGDTIVHDAVTGLPHRLDEAVGNPAFRRVASCDLDAGGVVIPAPVSAQVDSGVQPTLRLTTASGRSVTVTPHHPLLMPDGWRRADMIAVGESLALAARTPEPLMPAPMNDTLVDLLATLVADPGATTSPNRDTVTDPAVRDRAKAGTRTLDVTLPGRRDAASTVSQFRRIHGLDGTRATNGRLPDAVWCLPTSQVSRFVEVVLMCAGTVSTDGRVTITLGSEQLVRDLQSLLLRLGVQSTVDARTARQHGTSAPAGTLRVLPASLPALDAQVPLPTRMRVASGPIPARPTPATVAGGVNGPQEGGTRPHVDTLMRDSRENTAPTALTASPTVSGGSDLGAEDSYVLSPDLSWDQVVSITDAGPRHVYDLTVESTHNFIANDVVVHNTSVAANVAGQITLGDYRVLTVDLDLSGNLGLDLGYITHEQADEGLSIFNAIHIGTPLAVIKDVRPGLDVVPGGRRLEAVAALTNLPSEQPGGVPGAFARALAPLAAEYDIVVIDTAPGNPVLQDMALAAARYVIVPLRSDRSGVEGLRLVGPRVKKARDTINPQLTYLGAVIFGHTANASRVRRTAEEHLAVVGDKVPLLDAFIRHSEAVASDARERGLLAHELAAQVDESKAARLRYLAHRGGDTTGEAAPTVVSPVSASVAQDYTLLAHEILIRIDSIETAQQGAS